MFYVRKILLQCFPEYILRLEEYISGTWHCVDNVFQTKWWEWARLKGEGVPSFGKTLLLYLCTFYTQVIITILKQVDCLSVCLSVPWIYYTYFDEIQQGDSFELADLCYWISLYVDQLLLCSRHGVNVALFQYGCRYQSKW